MLTKISSKIRGVLHPQNFSSKRGIKQIQDPGSDFKIPVPTRGDTRYYFSVREMILKLNSVLWFSLHIPHSLHSIPFSSEICPWHVNTKSWYKPS